MTSIWKHMKKLEFLKTNKGKVFLCLAPLVFIAIIIAIYSIYTNPNKGTDNVDQGVNTGFIGFKVLDMQGNILPSRNIQIKSGEQFEGKVEIDNSIPQDRNYLLKIYDGYKFINFYLNGILSEEHALTIEAGAKKTFAIIINEELPEGIHDFAFFLIYEPDKQFDEIGMHDGKVTISRFNITIDQEKRIQNEKQFDIDKYLNPNYKSDLGFYVSNSANIDSSRGVKLFVSTHYSKKIQLFVNIPNTNNHTIQYKLLCLKGWKVIDIYNSPFLLFSLKPNENATIPVEIELEKKDIQSNLMLVLIPTPFESMDDDNLRSLAKAGLLIEPENSARIIILK